MITKYFIYQKEDLMLMYYLIIDRERKNEPEMIEFSK